MIIIIIKQLQDLNVLLMQSHFITRNLILQDVAAYYKVRAHVKRCGCILYDLAVCYTMW